MTSFQPGELRQAFGAFATGVTVVTTALEGKRYGVTANSFSSVSLDPPMVLWSLARTSTSFAAFENASAFAVHILAADQQPISDRFASKGTDKFAGIDVFEGLEGVPLLGGCAARFECRTAFRYEGGDHLIFVGEVAAFEHSANEPLLFHGGRYAKRLRVEADDQAAADDLSGLVARAYFHLLTPVRMSAAAAGLGVAEQYALTMLMSRREASLEEINDLIGHSGVTLSPDALNELVTRGMVTVREGVAALTDAGRTQVIALIAAARSLEADAQTGFEPEDMQMLKLLLGRLVAGLELRGDARITRHMDLMRDVVMGG